jgi:hypothetical protein
MFALKVQETQERGRGFNWVSKIKSFFQFQRLLKTYRLLILRYEFKLINK